MKKVIGIFMTMVMVFLIFSIAFGDVQEVVDFCNDHKMLEMYAKSMEINVYNIIGDCAYTIGTIGEQYDDIYDFMENYRSYLEKDWPDFADDVKIEYTYVGMTENYILLGVWLKLDNGKLMCDYVSNEPAVTEMSAVVYCKR